MPEPEWEWLYKQILVVSKIATSCGIAIHLIGGSNDYRLSISPRKIWRLRGTLVRWLGQEQSSVHIFTAKPDPELLYCGTFSNGACEWQSYHPKESGMKKIKSFKKSVIIALVAGVFSSFSMGAVACSFIPMGSKSITPVTIKIADTYFLIAANYLYTFQAVPSERERITIIVPHAPYAIWWFLVGALTILSKNGKQCTTAWLKKKNRIYRIGWKKGGLNHERGLSKYSLRC